MANEHDKHLAHRILTVLRKKYGRHSAATKEPALQELILGILADDSRERTAMTALRSLERSFVDWNEVRVSSVMELAAEMPGLADPIEKARLIRAVLHNVYDACNEMTLDYLKDRGPRDVLRVIAGIENFPEAALARAAVNGLDQDSLPVTPGLLQCCLRLRLLDDKNDHAAHARRLDRTLSRQSMLEFHWLVSRHSTRICLAAEPRCAECGLQEDCTTGKANLRAARATERAAAVKKRKSKRKKAKR